jgi:hypothetical protein
MRLRLGKPSVADAEAVSPPLGATPDDSPVEAASKPRAAWPPERIEVAAQLLDHADGQPGQNAA